MKNILSAFGILILMLISLSCNNTSKFEERFSGKELKAVLLTEKSLPHGAKIEDCKVIQGKLPLALLQNEYKSVRDNVNKARLDYRTCLTRGLNTAAQKNVDMLNEIQMLIQEKSQSLEASSQEFIFVMATVKERSTNKNVLTGYIAVFDPETLEKVDFIQVNRPLYNNAVMVTEALNGTLSDPTANDETESLKSDNPIVNFILGCEPK